MKNKLQGLGVGLAALAAYVPSVSANNSTPIAPPPSFFGDVGELINKSLRFVLVFAALLVFMYLIWGGIEWITSGGDKTKTESARNRITAAVVGLIVLAASWAILTLVLSFLGAGDLETLFNNAGI